MPIQYGLVPLPMTGGVDTRTEPKSLKPPKLAVCKNARFPSPGEIRKRQGYKQVLSSPQSTPSFIIHSGENIGAIDVSPSSKTYKADPNTGKWTTQSIIINFPGIRPNTVSVDQTGSITTDNLFYATAAANACGQVILDDYRVTRIWSTSASLGNMGIFNRRTNSMVAYFTTSILNTQVLGVGNTLLFLSVSGANMTLRAYDVAANMSGLPSDPEFLVGRNIAANVGANGVFDCCMAGSLMLIVYNTTTAGTIKAMLVDVNGTIINSVSLVTGAGNVVDAVGCSFGNGKIVVSAFDNTAHNPSEWVYNTTLTSLTTSLVNTRPGAMGAITVDFVTNCALSTGVTYTLYSTRAANTYDYAITEIANTNVFVGPLSHAILHSRLCVPDGTYPWFVMSYAGSAQSYFFLYSIEPTLANAGIFYLAGRFLPGLVPGVPKGSLPALQALDSVTLSYPALNFASDATKSATSVSNVTINLSPSYVPTAPGVVTAGGLPAIWDGETWKEQGFSLFPDNLTTVSSAAGGSLLPNTIYSYLAVYDILDVRGFRDHSTFGTASVVTTGGADNRVTVTAPTLAQSLYNFSRIRISFYRAAQGGTVYHLIGSVFNNPSSAYLSFVDTTSEANLIKLPELDNVSLDPVPLPNCTIITSGNQRIAVSGFDNPDLIQTSKFLDGSAPVFSDALTIVTPPTGTPITALAYLGDELIIFKSSHIYSVAGDGPDDLGAGGIFDTPRTITDSIGCTNPRSIVRMPSGLMFQSGKGIYLLGADHSLSYVGADVEAFNSEVVTSAVAMPGNNEVRFQTANRTLVYDYVQQAWSEWTIKGVEAFLYQGKYTYRETSTSPLLQETDGFFYDVDQSYALEIETPWISAAGAQGYMRVPAVFFLGDYKSQHQARVRITYNYEDGFSETVYWDPVPVVNVSLGTLQGMNSTATNSTGVYQYMVKVPHPKCEAIKVNVSDVSEGGVAQGEAFSLSEIALFTATKTGPMKLGATKRTG